MSLMLQAALSYAQLGWHVLPMHEPGENGACSCGQMTDYSGSPPHVSGKHPYPEHGHKDSSKDPAQIILWWEMWPDANVAIVTGAKSGLLVLDVDEKNNGYDSFAKMQNQYGPLPRTMQVKTGGGGLHFFFRHPGFEVRGRKDMEPGIDVFADGGKVVSAPSRHKSGNVYYWVEGNRPGEVAIADVPGWLLTKIQTKKNSKAIGKTKRKRYPWFLLD